METPSTETEDTRRLCYHPMTCPDCHKDHAPCGAHVPGRKGHESCTGRTVPVQHDLMGGSHGAQ